MTQVWIRRLMWLLTLSVMTMIFCFSAQEGDTSTALSDGIVHAVMRVATRVQPGLSVAQRETMQRVLRIIVRKGAHLTEYALLGAALAGLCKSYAWPHGGWISWGVGTLFAATDEGDQMFVSMRSASVADVMIDSLGVLMGMAITAWLIRRGAQAKARKES